MGSVSVLPPDTALAPAAAAPVPRENTLFPGLSKPVRVDIALAPHAAPPALRLARVAAIVPCHNRRDDAAALLADLASLDRTGIDLRVILIDNCSTIPLADLTSPGIPIEHVRLNTNTGGSGGYNAGLSLALSLNEKTAEPAWQEFDPEFVWLVDSDARVPTNTLRTLLDVLHADEHIAAAGPAIADPITGQPFELGGHINRRTGVFEPFLPGAAGVADVGFGSGGLGW